MEQMQATLRPDDSRTCRDDAWIRPRPTARQRRNDVALALALAAGVVFSLTSICLFLALYTAGAWG